MAPTLTPSPSSDARQWQASPQARFERLVAASLMFPIGLLVNGTQIRLVYAPEKELSGHLPSTCATWCRSRGVPSSPRCTCCCRSSGFTAWPRMNACPPFWPTAASIRTWSPPSSPGRCWKRSTNCCADSRQRTTRPWRSAAQVLARDPDHVYAGLLTTLLRLVFLLYAEDRGLLSTDPIYTNYYSVTGLYERLRADAGRYHDTMDQRYGAWAQLLALFRLIYSGGSHGAMQDSGA